KNSLEELESGLDVIRAAPADMGRVEMIVCRPGVGKRRILEEGELTLDEGLLGDSWKTRGSSSTPDRSAHPEMQLNLMNVRVIERVAGYRQAWPLDRKSTRLNSSHVKISYAVFCLKKKKNKNKYDSTQLQYK